jgi:hypothetical protein
MQKSLRTIGRISFDIDVLKSFFPDHQHITDKARNAFAA